MYGSLSLVKSDSDIPVLQLIALIPLAILLLLSVMRMARFLVSPPLRIYLHYQSLGQSQCQSQSRANKRPDFHCPLVTHSLDPLKATFPSLLSVW